MIQHDTVQAMDCFTAMTQIPDEGVDIVLTDPPYPNGMRLFTNNILDGYAALYYACKKAKNFVIFLWSPSNVPLPPRGWYEVARHVWAKPDARSITAYEVIVVWSKDYKRLASKVWSIPILDYRSLRDWKPHPTQKPVKLIRYLLDLYTNEGDLVLDPFVGSGTTAVACKQMHRHFIAVDNDPAYVAIANERLHDRNPEPLGPSPRPTDDPMIDNVPDGDLPCDTTPLDNETTEPMPTVAYPPDEPPAQPDDDAPVQPTSAPPSPPKRSHHTVSSREHATTRHPRTATTR